ncbi:MAG: hypothetical protein CM15mP128_0700 [Methanobacteriota archaeon]|nr:MAG: hypothetical protein CM15mP128_0700 [Euryarchaeota archaeon]
MVVVGSGIAGLFCALGFGEKWRSNGPDHQTKDPKGSSTNWGQGGIAAILTKRRRKPSRPTCKTPLVLAGTPGETVVRAVVNEAGDRIRDLLELGVNFQRDEDGTLHRVREGGHSSSRILHAKDATGREIERSLIDAISHHAGITVHSDTIVVDLIRRDHGNPAAGGPWPLGLKKEDGAGLNAHRACFSRCVPFGGKGAQIGPRPRIPGSTGDGLAMAAASAPTSKTWPSCPNSPPTSIEHPSRTFPKPKPSEGGRRLFG